MGEGGSGLYIDCEKMRNKVLGRDGMCVGVGSLTEAIEINKMGEIKGGATTFSRLRGFSSDREEGVY